MYQTQKTLKTEISNCKKVTMQVGNLIPSKIDPLMIINNLCGFVKHFPKNLSDLLKSENVEEILNYVSQCETDHMFIRVEKPLGSRNFITAFVPIHCVFSNHKRLSCSSPKHSKSTTCRIHSIVVVG